MVSVDPLSRSASLRMVRIALAGRRAVTAVGALFEDVLQGAPSPADAALHRAHRAAADVGRLLVGEAAGADQDQRLALLVGQHAHGEAASRPAPPAPRDRRRRRACAPRRPGPAATGATSAASRGVELVAKDHEGPGLHVGAHLEAGPCVPRLERRVLRQVVGRGGVAAQSPGERAQVRDKSHEIALERLFRGGVENATLDHQPLNTAGSTPYRRRDAGYQGSPQAQVHSRSRRTYDVGAPRSPAGADAASSSAGSVRLTGSAGRGLSFMRRGLTRGRAAPLSGRT